MVLAVTWTAERVHPRVGGLITAVPMASGLTLLFLGLEVGPAFAGETAFWFVPSLASTLWFCFGYLALARLVEPRRVLAIGTGVAGGTIAFAIPTAIVGTLALPGWVAVATPVGMIAVAHAALRRLPQAPRTRPIHLRPAILLVRAASAAVGIVAVTSIARLIGPRWSGLLTGYPVNYGPIIGILHYHYGLGMVGAVMKVFPLGLVGVILFDLTAWVAVPRAGVWGGLGWAYGVDLAYLVLLDRWQRRRPGTEGSPRRHGDTERK
jgi:hypothetical protein